MMSRGPESSGGISSGTRKLPPSSQGRPTPFFCKSSFLGTQPFSLIGVLPMSSRPLSCFKGRVQKLQERPYGCKAKDTDRLALPRKRSMTSALDWPFRAAAWSAPGLEDSLLRGLSCVLQSVEQWPWSPPTTDR